MYIRLVGRIFLNFSLSFPFSAECNFPRWHSVCTVNWNSLRWKKSSRLPDNLQLQATEQRRRPTECKLSPAYQLNPSRTHTHTHTHTKLYLSCDARRIITWDREFRTLSIKAIFLSEIPEIFYRRGPCFPGYDRAMTAVHKLACSKKQSQLIFPFNHVWHSRGVALITVRRRHPSARGRWSCVVCVCVCKLQSKSHVRGLHVIRLL